MSEKDGGAAFPNITPDMPVDGGPGMSLRDYFAAQALTGLLSDNRIVDTPQSFAARAYEVADAMLAERAK